MPKLKLPRDSEVPTMKKQKTKKNSATVLKVRTAVQAGKITLNHNATKL